MMIAPERLSPYAERAGEPARFFVGVSARRVFFVGVFARRVRRGCVSVHPADATALAVRGRLRAAGVALGRLLRLNLVVIMTMALPVGGRVRAGDFYSAGRP